MTASYKLLHIGVWLVLAGIMVATGSLAKADDGTQALRVAFRDGPDSTLKVKAGTFTTTKDAKLGRLIIAADKAPLQLASPSPQTGARAIHALVRLRTETAPSAVFSLSLAKKDSKDPGFRVVLSTSRGSDAISCQVQHAGKALHDLAALRKDLDWEPDAPSSFAYYPRAYAFKDIRPGWPEDFRARIEHDMAALPGVTDKWLSVRVELRPSPQPLSPEGRGAPAKPLALQGRGVGVRGEILFWLDDRLVARKSGADVSADGFTQLDLSPGVQLAGYEVKPWTPTHGFLPLHLEGYANARALLAGAAVKPESLPAGPQTTIAGIPFVLPTVNAEGNDHIDVGRSLYRQANLDGYLPSSGPRWVGSSHRDPARIQLRIPNGQYDSLYLLAACDDRRDSLPLVTALFYRPSAGFAERFAAEVPLATATSANTQAVPVTLANGKRVHLWLVKVPLDPGRLSAFTDMDIMEVELTKKVQQFRSYPDPFIYGWHQGGPPSAVHVYAATLGQVPVGFRFEPDRFGHVWTAPAVPSYTATLVNRTDRAQQGQLTLTTRSYDGTETTRQEVSMSLAPGETKPVKLSVPVKLNGYHDVHATLALNPPSPPRGEGPGVRGWTENRSLVRLAPDTRAPRWTEGKGALFGYWSYHGGHHTPKADRHIELMTAAGARTSIGLPNPNHELVKKHWARVPAGAWEVAPQPWAMEEPFDAQKYAAYRKQVIDAFTKARAPLPPAYQPDHVYFFPEPHVSQRLTEGNYPEYWHGTPYTYTADEQRRLRMFLVTARCAAEAVRQTWPDLKVLIPWGDPLFVVPLLRGGFPKGLIDGAGLDIPGFERLPEMQLHQISLHRLYELRQEFARAGIPNPVLQYSEGIFVPTEPGAVSWREQMDIYNRWTLLSMAYGVKRFYSGWFAFDCGNYYGSEHYGGCGIQRRIPYCDPKPAYAAYATMTQQLDQANFDGWLKTGSLTTYALRFRGPLGPVYTLWTIRGKRPVTLTLAADGAVRVTDAMNNTRTISSRNRQVTVPTDPSVLYVSGAEVTAVAVGKPDHADAQPAEGARLVADLGDGSWSYSDKHDATYEKGTFGMARYPGKLRGTVATDPVHGKVLASTLEKQDTVHELMPWYRIVVPKKPVVLAGAPAALGLWVKGGSDWGRVIYTLRDAKGEQWTSIGTQDQYNCDDLHSWSAFNFDGWRYLRFELPGHAGYDNFRKHGTTWWRSDGGDGIVDLPLTLENLIVEQRSHILYVNDVQPAASDTVCFGKLYVEYAAPADATPEAVRLSRLRQPLPPGAPALPNPIADMQRDGTGPATTILKLEPPLQMNDGTTVHVHFQEAAGAKKHFVWVSAHADGRGAVNMTPQGAPSGVLVRGLRPAVKFHFWVTYQDAQGKMSKPSPVAGATLVDTFSQK